MLNSEMTSFTLCTGYYTDSCWLTRVMHISHYFRVTLCCCKIILPWVKFYQRVHSDGYPSLKHKMLCVTLHRIVWLYVLGESHCSEWWAGGGLSRWCQIWQWTFWIQVNHEFDDFLTFFIVQIPLVIYSML